jgi:hypothetical protein
MDVAYEWGSFDVSNDVILLNVYYFFINYEY